MGPRRGERRQSAQVAHQLGTRGWALVWLARIPHLLQHRPTPAGLEQYQPAAPRSPTANAMAHRGDPASRRPAPPLPAHRLSAGRSYRRRSPPQRCLSRVPYRRKVLLALTPRALPPGRRLRSDHQLSAVKQTARRGAEGILARDSSDGERHLYVGPLRGA